MPHINQQQTEPFWNVSTGLTPYADALKTMEEHVAQMAAGTAREQIWLVEHEPVITAGTSASSSDLLDPSRFPLFETGRGGKLTFHGPGQRVVYPMLNLGARCKDIRKYVSALEAWAIAALSEFGVTAFPHEAGTGIWVNTPTGLAKIGAIGVRVRKWISFHGMALNVTTDLTSYDSIVPCGISEFGITKLSDLSPKSTMQDLDNALLKHFPKFLGEIN